MTKKSICFIPVYNQVRELPGVLEELRSIQLPVDTILLINNGSSDGSEELVHKSGFDYIDLPKNRGIGYSFMIATDWALEHGYEVFSVMASNGKMRPRELERVVEPVLSGRYDYVTGSRFLSGGSSPNLPKFRGNAIPAVNGFVRVITGKTITDSTCGFKAYRLDLFRKSNFDWKKPWLETYGFEYYLYCKVLIDKNLRWAEVPITMQYPPKGQKYTKMKPFVSWWHMLKPWLIARLDGKGFDRKALSQKASG